MYNNLALINKYIDRIFAHISRVFDDIRLGGLYRWLLFYGIQGEGLLDHESSHILNEKVQAEERHFSSNVSSTSNYILLSKTLHPSDFFHMWMVKVNWQ